MNFICFSFGVFAIDQVFVVFLFVLIIYSFFFSLKFNDYSRVRNFFFFLFSCFNIFSFHAVICVLSHLLYRSFSFLLSFSFDLFLCLSFFSFFDICSSCFLVFANIFKFANRVVFYCKCRIQQPTVAFTQNEKSAIEIVNAVELAPVKVNTNHCSCTIQRQNMHDTNKCKVRIR